MKGLGLSQESPDHYPGNWLDFPEGIHTITCHEFGYFVSAIIQPLWRSSRDNRVLCGGRKVAPTQSQRELWAAVHILQMACALWDCSKVLENNEG